MSNNAITLYPSNWLYNAGVIGLLRVLEAGGEDFDSLIARDGSIDGKEIIARMKEHLDKKNTDLPEPLDNLPNWHWNYVSESFKWNYGSIQDLVIQNLQRASKTTNRKPMVDQLQCKNFKYESTTFDFSHSNDIVKQAFGEAFGRNPSSTILQATEKVSSGIAKMEKAFIFRKAVGFLFAKGGPYQNFFNPNQFSDLRKFIDAFNVSSFLKSNDSTTRCGFCGSLDFECQPVDARMMTVLFPVYSKFPNAYWTNNKKIVTSICSLCKFILLHYHLGFARLAVGTWMFVNAPSFVTMYHLNKLLQQSMTGSTSTDSKKIRELLASSVVEFTTKMQTTLGIWTGMNIEVVTKRGNQVEYLSLPYQVINLISTRSIASMVNDIGEFRVLTLVLNQEYSKLTEVGYRLLRESISDRRNYDYINYWLYLERNKRDLSKTANKILKLYALIEERRRN
ncbi:MAG: hypothetical protein ACE5GN_05305, partial [Waddliaceae bacterium]